MSHGYYVRALEQAGADVVTVHPGDGPEAVDGADGICLSGGGDIDPGRYGEADVACNDDIDPARDELELALARRAIERDLPVLGICRGFQLLNVAFGGRLVQHADGHRPEPHPVRAHTVRVSPGSRLGEAMGGGEAAVNSRHHQAVGDGELAPSLRATARVDGLIEAFESGAHRWIVAVQWHPERHVRAGAPSDEVSPDAVRVFDAFVRAASRSAVRAV